MGLALPVLVTVTLPALAGLVLLAGRGRWPATWPGAAPDERLRPRARDGRQDRARGGGAGARLSPQEAEIEAKAGNEPVTEADRAANALIVERLAAAFPKDTILSEEIPDTGARLGRSRIWMVDPIDGTSDFILGDTGFVVMIGLCVDGRPMVGAVAHPLSERVFGGVVGAGAWVEDAAGARTPLQTSTIERAPGIRLVASKTHRTQRVDRIEQALQIEDEINVGSVGLKIGLVTEAERDLYVYTGGRTKIWDTCGPEAVLRRRGRQDDGRRRAPAGLRPRGPLQPERDRRLERPAAPLRDRDAGAAGANDRLTDRQWFASQPHQGGVRIAGIAREKQRGPTCRLRLIALGRDRLQRHDVGIGTERAIREVSVVALYQLNRLVVVTDRIGAPGRVNPGDLGGQIEEGNRDGLGGHRPRAVESLARMCPP